MIMFLLDKKYQLCTEACITESQNLFLPEIHLCIVPLQIHAFHLVKALLIYQADFLRLGFSSEQQYHLGGSQNQYYQATGISGPGDQMDPLLHQAIQFLDL